jgi:serpin B
MKKYLFLSYLLQICAPQLFAQSLSETVKGNNYFAFDFYQEISKLDRENIICSPFSISNAVAIAYAGAKGNTAAEIASVFYFAQSGDALHANFQQINEKIEKSQSEYTSLKMVNRLWFTEKFTPKEDFLNLCQKYYKGGTQSIDFENFALARTTMNNWARKETKQKINNLLPEGSIVPLTRLVVMNAVYFKGDWQKAFDATQTEQKDFYTENEITQSVPFMAQKNSFRYLKQDSLQVLELPYKGGKYAMLVFLPNKEIPFTQFENNFTAKNYYKWLNLLTQQKVNVVLPKFTISPEKGYELKESLKNMGIKEAFLGTADFSGAFNMDTPVSLANVFHKGFIAVDETGTEAAASTAVVMQGRSGSESPYFYANHPFIYLIKDIQNGNIIFMGRVTNLK